MACRRTLLLFVLLLSLAGAAAPSNSTAERWLRRLTLRERIAQLVFVPFYADTPATGSKAFAHFVQLVGDLRVGGLLILNRPEYGIVKRAEPHAMAAFLNRLQRMARVPLLIGGDFERGASMRVAGTVQFPYAMAFGAAGDLDATLEFGRATAREARALGVHWLYVPVADVNNNPDNPIINTRAFSENPAAVADHVRAFIAGTRLDQGAPVLTTVKHFPGHGDTAVDSHLGLGTVPADRARLDAVELVPFRAAIAAGVDAVMTAHLAVPALEPEEIPATVSRRVLTGLLREELGFRGIITTDAMDMQGLTKLFPPGEAAVRALEAGADVLLVPSDPSEAVAGVARAVRQGRLSPRRIDASVRRVLAAKVRVGLDKRRTVDVEKVADAVDLEEDQALAARVAGQAITAVRNRGNLLPLDPAAPVCHFLLAGSRYSTMGREMADALRRSAPGARVAFFDAGLGDPELAAATVQAGACEAIAVSAFVAVSSARGNVALSGGYPRLIERLATLGKPLLLVAFGNPYLLRAFPGVDAYVATFSTATTSETAAVRAIYGEIPIRGRLPVTIPGQAAYGDGLEIAPRR